MRNQLLRALLAAIALAMACAGLPNAPAATPSANGLSTPEPPASATLPHPTGLAAHDETATAAAGQLSQEHASATAPPDFALTPAFTVDIEIDPAAQYQTISGFGATFRAFNGPLSKLDDPHGPDFTTANLEQAADIADILYRQFGLTRSRLLPDLFEPANDNADPLSFNPSAYNWSQVDQLIEFATISRPLGLQTPWLSFSIDVGHSQAWLRKPDSCALNPAMLDEDVEWILAAAVHFRDAGQEVPYLTVNNEPDLCPPGRKIEISDYVTIVKRLGIRLREQGLVTQIVVSDGWIPQNTLLYAQAVLADPEARVYVGAIATHAYADGYDDPATVLAGSAQGNPPHGAVEVRAKLRDLATQYGLPLWMTEICYCTPRSPEFSEFELLRARLNHLNDELTWGNASAFDAMNLYNIRRPGVYDELVEVYFRDDGSLERYEVSTYGRLLSQYALAIAPGSMRIKADTSDPRVRALAFIRPDGKLVVNLLNNNASTVQANLNSSVTFSTLLSRENAIWQAGPYVTNAIILPSLSLTTLIEE